MKLNERGTPNPIVSTDYTVEVDKKATKNMTSAAKRKAKAALAKKKAEKA